MNAAICRKTLIAALAGLCVILIGGVSQVYAGTLFTDCSFDEESGVLTVHSNVPDDALWPDELVDGSVTELIFDDGVTEIGYRGCYDSVFNKTKKITFSSSVKKIGEGAFWSTANLPAQEYVFNEGLEEIGNRAFSMNYANVETLDLPSTLKRIGDGAFMNMTVKHLALPAGVEYIGPGAFAGVEKFDDSLGANYTCMGGCLYDKDVTKLVQFPKRAPNEEYIAPSTLKSIGELAINKPQWLSVIVLPEGFEDVEDNAVQFTGSIYEQHYYVFPTTLKHVGTGNFNTCYIPIGFRGTKEQWDAVDIEDREKAHYFGSPENEYLMFYNYDITGIYLPDITIPPKASVRIFPIVYPMEAQSEAAADGRSTFARYNDWTIWSLDENGDVQTDDTVISKTDYVDGSIVLHAQKEGEGGAAVYAYARHANCQIHVKPNTPRGGGIDPPADNTSGIAHPGETVQMSNGVIWPDGTEQTGVYTSSDENVATVSDTGLVSFHNTGTAMITADYDCGLKIEQEFTVEEKNSSGDDLDEITPSEETANKAAVDTKIPKVAAGKIVTSGNIAKKQMSVKFPGSAKVDNYRIQYRLAGKTRWTSKWTGGKSSYIIKNLAKNSLCQFRLAGYAKQEDGSWKRGAWSNISCRYMKSVTLKKVTPGVKKLTVTWTKDTNASGYQIQYSLKSSMAGANTITISGKSKTKCTIKKLKKGKKYYVKVRPIKTKANKRYLGILTKAKAARVK